MPFLRHPSSFWGEFVDARRDWMGEERVMRSTTATLLAMKTPRRALDFIMMRALASRVESRVSIVSRT